MMVSKTMQRLMAKSCTQILLIVIAMAGLTMPIAIADDQQAKRDQDETDAIRKLIERAQQKQANRATNASADPAQQSPPMQLKLSGNDVSVEVLDNGEIVLIGNDDDLAILESFIELLDQQAPEKASVLHTLKSAPAKDVAEKLQSIVEELWPASKDLPEQRITTIAVTSNVILIIGPNDRIDRVVEIADAIDEVKAAIPAFQTMKFFIKYRKAVEVVDQLEKIITKLNAQRPDSEEITLEANDADNSVMVFGPETLREQLQSLIDQIDVEPVKGHGHVKLVIFPLINTAADDLASTLTDMLTTDAGKKDVQETIRRLSIIKREADGTHTELTPLNLDVPLRIFSDKGTNSVIIATVDENIAPFAEIIEILDGTPLGHELKMRIFPLKFADAESVQGILEQMFDDGKKLPERAPGGTKTEAVPQGTLGTALVYNVGIAIDKRANIVFVSGRPEQLVLSELVVNELDVPVTSVKFPLQLLFLGDRLDATRVSSVITELFDKRMELYSDTDMGTLAKAREKVFLTVDVASNALIVSASEENYAEIESIIVQLTAATQRVINDIRLITCDKTNASDLVSKIDDLWQRRAKLKPEGAIEDTPVIVADQRSNALIIASSAEDYDAIQSLITQLESQPLSPIAEIRLIVLKNNDAKTTGDMLKSLFEERAKQRLTTGQDENPTDRVAVASDLATNSILVASSEENFNEMSRIVSAIDIEPIVEGVVQYFVLKNAEASDVADKVKDIFGQGLYHPSAGLDNPIAKERQKVALISDARSNSIIVSASRQNLSIVETLIKQMDGEIADLLKDDTKIIPLEFADAVRLTDMLTQLFEGRQSDAVEPDLFRKPTILADARSNTLIISGARDSLQRCEGLIEQLDRPAGAPTATFEVYALKHGSAIKLATKMQEAFDNRAQGQEEAGVPISIQADEASNSLIASASRSDHEQVASLLKLLDRPSNIAKQFQIFPLTKTKAEVIADTLDQLFQQQADGGSGRADAIAVQPDARSNSLVVWASPSEMDNIATIVNQLDTAESVVEMTVKVIRLKQALAEDFAKILQDTLGVGDQQGDNESAVILSFTETLDDGTEVLRKLMRQDITITPDPRTNSLMVMAPAESMDLLEAMIVDFDRVKPVTAEIRMFPLVNADADEVVQRLEDVFGTGDSGGDGIERTLVFGGEDSSAGGGEGSTLRLELRFTADRRTNTVVAAGNPIDLSMVEQLIAQLDARDIDERVQEIYRARFMPATDIASALDEFSQAENQLLSELDDAVSIRRRADKQVTVVSDEDSNTILLGASQRNYPQYMDLIRQIDKPAPQVMISVLIAEVSMDDRYELGVEFAAQDLNFTENAFTNPNGVIQGEKADVVFGTDIGAAGVGFGGLSLTVSGEDFSFLFHALESQGEFEVLSRPTLLVQNNAEGNITIGDRVPIVSGSTSAGGQSSTQIQYEEVGIILQVTPHINPDGYVNLEIAPEISQISNQSLQVAEGLNAAVFSQRTAETTVTIKDGETVVLGGLITENIQNSVVKVPFFGDLPYIGELFKTTNKNSTKTELLIVLTVNVLRNEEELKKMSEEELGRTGRFPERIKRHPLMQGLRIRADDDLLGPVDDGKDQRRMEIETPELDRSIYGPIPRHYGPTLPTASVEQTGTLSRRAVYGPRLVRNEP